MFEIATFFWGFLTSVTFYFGIIIVPATFYGVLECIKSAVQGKSIKEYMKAFIWTSVGLILVIAPVLAGTYIYH